MIDCVKEGNYLVKNDKFRGPVNVLLKLIQKRKIDICQIKLSVIIRNFLDYIKKKKEILLDELSNFLYIASILLEIKSKSIIPSRNVKKDKEEDFLDENILRRREKEYKIYRRISNYFEKLYDTEQLYFLREAPVEENFLNLFPDFLKDISLKDISILASKLLKHEEDQIKIDDYIYNNSYTKTIFDEMRRIKEILSYRSSITFKELASDYNKIIDKIICFLSILELYKSEVIDIMQFESFGNIVIKRI